MLKPYSKELNNMDTKKVNKNNYTDAGLNMIVNKIKEKIGSRITLINNEIKDIMKIILLNFINRNY